MEAKSGTNSNRNRIFRKQLVIPAEHGSWPWFLVPYFVGVLVAREWNFAAALVLIGGLAGFLVRQPAISWMRIRAGKGRKADLGLARAWTIGLGSAAAGSFIGLLLMGLVEMLWLLIPMVVIFVLYLIASRQRRASVRTLWMEAAGAAGLAAAAPAAYIAATGSLDETAWVLWGLMAAQNALGVLYVRTRIADTRGREMSRSPILAGHVGALLLVIAAAVWEIVPWLVVVPYAAYLARAVWTAVAVRPVENVVRFGFSEVGVEIAGGLLVAAGYWLQ
ncbi:MAG: YwiC-like family protein [Candidatus Promineifilaceae bacterium]